MLFLDLSPATAMSRCAIAPLFDCLCLCLSLFMSVFLYLALCLCFFFSVFLPISFFHSYFRSLCRSVFLTLLRALHLCLCLSSQAFSISPFLFLSIFVCLCLSYVLIFIVSICRSCVCRNQRCPLKAEQQIQKVLKRQQARLCRL